MPGTFTDDFEYIGAAADNFNCDATGGWTNTGNLAAAINSTGDGIDGGTCVGLKASGASGVGEMYQDVSAGSRFKITENVLIVWFFYLKGKGANYLQQTGAGIRIKLYFGGTTAFAEYYPTNSGDLSLNNGWNLLYISGTNLNGGTTSGSPTFTDDVHRVGLVLDFANGNDAGQDPELRMDNWQIGTKVQLTTGTTSGSKATIDDFVSWSDGTGRTGRTFPAGNGPLGVVTRDDVFVQSLCGLQFGNGTNDAFFEEDSKFILFNQWSEEVKANVEIEDNADVQFGVVEVGSDANYAVQGCQLVLPANRFSDINVKEGGTLKLYDCKLFRWRDVFLGAASDSTSTVDLNQVDIDGCDRVYFRANTLDILDVLLHDCATDVVAWCGEITVSPDSCENLLVYNNPQGLHFRATLTINEYFAQDNTTSDLSVLEGTTATIINGSFANNKIARLAA